MRRRTLIGVLVLAIMTLGLPASATVHEIVGAACNGKDFIDPPGLGSFGFAGQSTNSPDALAPLGSFARPVLITGAVDGDLLTTGHPAGKFKPNKFAPTLTTGDLDHKSSDNCKAFNP